MKCDDCISVEVESAKRAFELRDHREKNREYYENLETAAELLAKVQQALPEDLLWVVPYLRSDHYKVWLTIPHHRRVAVSSSDQKYIFTITPESGAFFFHPEIEEAHGMYRSRWGTATMDIGQALLEAEKTWASISRWWRNRGSK